MIIDGVLGSQCVDSSGEVLDVDGADIIDLEEGRGVLNYEHQSADEKDEKGEHKNQGQEIVGKILTAKKVFKESDCSSARERIFWKKVKHPFIYGVCRLYDGAGHEGAKALAAQIRDHHANGEPILVRFSVEGSTLKKEGNVLKASVIRKVALTLKPCNRTADSGLLEDPNAPAGWDKKPEKAHDILESIGKHEHPLYRRLGGEFVTEYSPIDEVDHTALIKSIIKLKVMRKALTAGMPGASAPSQLTGGAALQREDIVKFKTKAMKCLKSFLDKNEDFEKADAVAAIKAELPEASDDFIEHFANIAEDYKHKLRKDIDHGLEDDLPKLNPGIGAGLAGDKPRVDIGAEPSQEGAALPHRKGSHEMKPGGKLLIQKPGAGKGSSRVALQQHFPDDEHYHSLLKPDLALAGGKIDGETYQNIVRTIHEPWHRAMSHWLPLNKALSEGKVPKGILAKSVIFAAMSPNTPVNLQERYYGHYMDMMHEGKVDPFRPFTDENARDFTARSTNGTDPKWNREFYQARPIASHAGGGDNQVEVPPADDKNDLPQIRGLRNAHQMFPYLEHLIAKHRDNTQQIAGELMDMKAEHNRWQSNSRTRMAAGKDPHAAPEGNAISGYGPKLTRYMLGMLGGGNMIVPDRHMVRSSFDLALEPDPQNEGKFRGSSMLDKLQTSLVTKSKNEPLLRAMDHNFFVKHPAVKHVLETFPKHFAGREQQAIFPAFWLHWLTIGQHDRMRGRPFQGFNEDTDHRPFWDSVKDEMIKHGLTPHPLHDKRPQMPDEDDSFDFGANLKKGEDGKPLDPWPRHPDHHSHPVWLKAAGVVQALRQRWGENPALLAFFSHVMPHVMAAETPVPPVTSVPHPAYQPQLAKAEELMINLRKALAADGSREHPALDEVAPHIHHVYRFIPSPDLKINRHAAGRFMTAGNHLHILEDYHGHLKGALNEGPMDKWKAQQVANLRTNHKYEVVPLSDIRAGKRPDLWEAPTKAQQAPKPRSFEYIRQGQDKADHLEYIGAQPHLNGHPLDRGQTEALLQHLRNGHASIRYKAESKGSTIQKMELILTELMKSDDPAVAEGVHSALGKLDELVKAGHLAPEHAEALRNHAFKDPMTGHVMGNKFAYSDFLNRQEGKGGVHVALDGNDFKSVNDKFGHQTGDRAIKGFGEALRGAMDEAAPGQGKLFRVGGDEFAAHVPSHEHAAAFGRALRNRLEAMPAIEGNHKISMSMGFGADPHNADKALYHAKSQKLGPMGTPLFEKGAAPNMAHSLVPGFEGPVPLDHTQLHVKPPPAPAPLEQAQAPAVHTPVPGSAPQSAAHPPVTA